MRRAARKDANHNGIAAYLQNLGWSVIDTSNLGNGFPDLAVGRAGFACLVEIKDGSKPPSARKLTPLEQKFAEQWTGPYIVARGPQDAADQLFGLWKKWGTAVKEL